MKTGSRGHLPASVQVLLASVLFTILSFFVARELWNVPIPAGLLAGVLALQASTVLLERARFFTPLGAAVLAVAAALTAYFAAALRLVPSHSAVQTAALISGGAAVFFVLSSTVTVLRGGTSDLDVAVEPAGRRYRADPRTPDAAVSSTDGPENPGEGTDLEEDLWDGGVIQELNHDRFLFPQDGPDEGAGDGYLLDDPIDLTEGTESLGYVVTPDPAGEDRTAGEPAGAVRQEESSEPHPLRYLIYERKTMQPLGEFVPEGDHPRLDRLALYRMFPEYDYRTFQIESIRWHEETVGIYIRGAKKGKPEAVRGTAGDPAEGPAGGEWTAPEAGKGKIGRRRGPDGGKASSDDS